MSPGLRGRRAGIMAPLFSLRSRHSWGIGELRDVAAASAWLRAGHQSLLQLLPLNELAPGETSPYSALSAMAIDPRYLTIRGIEDAPDFDALWADELAEVRAAPRVPYARVSALKNAALRICFERFCENEWDEESERAVALRDYIRREHWWLDDYALYRALRQRAGERPWTEWDPALRDRQPEALASAREGLAREILFRQYVQWVAARQWRIARSDSMGVELVGDFPFMVTLDSADVWSRQTEFILDASVGTPPDAFSETGQEWGLPPYNWTEARRNGFEWLRLRARRMADLYDGFRVDHLVGFYRTYVRPHDGQTPFFLPATEPEQLALGEMILAVIVEAGSEVSVEDLGTVPDFVRESVARLGLPGYRVFRWEPGDPSTYPPESVAMTGTHDTESIAVWWESLGAEERRRFVEMPSVRAPDSPRFDVSVRDAVLKALYGSQSDVVQIPMQDVFGWPDRINHPATVGGWNWTWTLPWPVDSMAAQPEAVEAAERLRQWSLETGR